MLNVNELREQFRSEKTDRCRRRRRSAVAFGAPSFVAMFSVYLLEENETITGQCIWIGHAFWVLTGLAVTIFACNMIWNPAERLKNLLARLWIVLVVVGLFAIMISFLAQDTYPTVSRIGMIVGFSSELIVVPLIMVFSSLFQSSRR